MKRLGGVLSRRTVIAAAVVAGAVAAIPEARAQTKLNIGISVKSVFGLPLVVARDKGFFRDEGLEVTLEYFTGGPPGTAALMGGSLQFLNAAFENNLKTVKAGQPIVTIMNIQSDFAGAMIIRKDLADKLGRQAKVQDLKGLRIGTNARGGFADVAARYVLKDVGLEPEKDAEMVPIRGADRQLAAGKAGQIDAALVTEPWSAIAVEGMNDWRYVLNMTTGEGPEVFQDMGYVTLQTTGPYLEKNRDTAEKVVRAVVRAQTYIADLAHLDEITNMAKREYGDTGGDAMRISVERQARTYVPFMKPTMIKKTVDLLAASDPIEGPVPEYGKLVDTKFEPLWAAYKAK